MFLSFTKGETKLPPKKGVSPLWSISMICKAVLISLEKDRTIDSIAILTLLMLMIFKLERSVLFALSEILPVACENWT